MINTLAEVVIKKRVDVLVFEVYNNDEIITEDVISSEFNTYGTIDIGSLNNYENIKIIVSYYPVISNSSKIEIFINN